MIDVASLRQGLLRPDAGGFCAFEGWVRDHHLGKDVLSLEYEAYEPLALRQGNALLEQACENWGLLGAVAVHRIGHLKPGEIAVWVGVCSAHRREAFAACRRIIDDIKATVPIWKHEFYRDGTDVWVDPTDCHCAEEGEAHAHCRNSPGAVNAGGTALDMSNLKFGIHAASGPRPGPLSGAGTPTAPGSAHF